MSDRSRTQRRRRGFSLVEALVASAVTAVLLVSAMQLAGSVALGRRALDDRALAGEIADGLIAEILSKAYTDPVTPTTFGREAGETATDRTTYDDVDDYDGYTTTVLFTGRTAAKDGYVATIAVRRATLLTPSIDSSTETGLKRIGVTVTRQGRTIVDRFALKGDAP